LRTLFTLALVLTLSPTAFARELYAIGVDSSRIAAPPCEIRLWQSDVVFLNTTFTEQTVTLLDISNGSIPAGTTHQLVVPPQHIVTLQGSVGNQWKPSDPAVESVPLWMWHLDVPEGVTAHARLSLGDWFPCLRISPNIFPFSRGEISLPLFDHLVPANGVQSLLATDLGLLDRRLNVIVFNAGNVTAHAAIEVRSACDGALLAGDVFDVPPDTALQRTRVLSGPPPCAASAGGTYTVVQLDQPGLAVASALSNGEETILTHNFIAP
jgi:hypothetical protein